MKHGLKKDYTDKEIMDLLLKNLSFTDLLIKQHMSGREQIPRLTAEKDQIVYAPRNEASYREFVKSTYFSKDQEDPFSHFYIKESGKIERLHKTYDEHQTKYKDLIDKSGQ